MRALALTGPRALPKHLTEFQKIAESTKTELKLLHSLAPEAVANTLASFHPECVLIFGGDGTLHCHLSSLVGSQIPVLLVPVGSGNDFARAHGIRNISDAAQLWRDFLTGQASATLSDLALISAHTESGSVLKASYFSCCANIGLDSDAAQRTNSLPNWLKANAGYFVAALASLVRYQPQMISVTSNSSENVANELAWFVSISNTPTYGGGLKIAPQASITDGQLDITFLPRARFSRLQLLRHISKIFNGSHVELSGIKIFAAARISVKTKLPLPIYADAEPVGFTPCTIGAVSNAISMLRFKSSSQIPFKP